MDRRAEVTRRPDLKRWPLASHHAPPRPKDYREARGMATAGLGLLGGPASLTRGCPASHVRMAHLHHPTASNGSGRNAQELPLKRGVPRIQNEAEPPICLPWIVDATPMHHRGKMHVQHHVVMHGRWHSATQVTKSDREAYTGTRGALPPRAPPLQSVQSSKRAVARGRKVSCVCVCCCC